MTFPAGVTNVTFSVTINNDTILEDNEKFSLTINTDSLPNNIIAGTPSTVTVIKCKLDIVRLYFEVVTLCDWILENCPSMDKN